MHRGLSEIALPIDEIIAEGDRVLVRLRMKGRHTGDFQSKTATGASIDTTVRITAASPTGGWSSTER